MHRLVSFNLILIGTLLHLLVCSLFIVLTLLLKSILISTPYLVLFAVVGSLCIRQTKYFNGVTTQRQQVIMRLSLPTILLFGAATHGAVSANPGFLADETGMTADSYELQGFLAMDAAAQDVAAAAAEVTISYNVIDDSFVRDSSPTKNYNGVTNLGVGYGTTNNERITFTKFPISFEVQNAASISSAVIWMRVNQAPAVSLKIQFFPCDTENWSESVITWNDRPTYDNSTGAELAEITLFPADDNTWFSFDMTTPVIAAAQAQQSSLSIVIQPETVLNEPLGDAMKFDSKEDGTNIPYLEVTYTPGQNTDVPSSSPSSSPTIDYDQPDYPQLVSFAPDGSLEYVPYANEINVVQGSTANPAAVNTVPDFSAAGYKGGGVPIPFVPVIQTVSSMRELSSSHQ